MRPGVYYQQFDLSQVVSGTDGVTLGICGNAKWGPVDEAVKTSSSKQFVDLFLPPTSSKETPMHYQLFDYYMGGKSAYVVRPQGQSKYGVIELVNQDKKKVTTITLTASGTNYSVGDVIALKSASGLGTGAEFTVLTVGANGQVLSGNITANGDNYVDGENLIQDSVSADSGLAGITIISGGSNYSENEVLSVVGTQGGSNARVRVSGVNGSGAITELVILDGGTAFNNAEPLNFSLFSVPSSLKNATIKTGGIGYSVNDLLNITSTTGSGATVRVDTVDVDGAITAMTVTSFGSGYVNNEELATASVTPVGGTGATFTASVATGGTGMNATAVIAVGSGLAGTANCDSYLGSGTGALKKTFGTQKYRFFTIYPGDLGSALYLQVVSSDTTTGDFVIRVGSTVVGSNISNEGTYFEQHEVSLSRTSFDGFGRSKFVKEVLTRDSKLIDIAIDEDTTLTTDVPPTSILPVEFGGAEYVQLTTSEVAAGYTKLLNPDDLEINLLIASDSDVEVSNAVISVAESRQDCFAIITPSVSEVWTVEGLTNATTGWINKLSPQSWRWAAYASYHYQRDVYNDRDVMIPSAGLIAGMYVKSIVNYGAHYAPAGSRRGAISMKKLGRFWSAAEKDELYKANINYVANTPGQGPIVEGQRTRNTIKSALSGINVALLMIKIRKDLMNSLKPYIDEFNNTKNRQIITMNITSYLSRLKTDEALYDFRVICDDSNNTAAVIDNNELFVDIYVKPVKVAEFIYLRNTITSTGVDFNMVVKS